MDAETIREYCLSKKGTEESMPFGEDTLVIKVMGKIFLLMNLYGDLSINLKCNPIKAMELREQYPAVFPGYHMNKLHWNTVMIDGSVPEKEINSWIDDSYELVVASLTKIKREEWKKL